MTPAVSIVLLWLGFAGTHLVLSHLPVRDRVIARVGARPFQGLYSLVALAFFVPMVSIYFDHIHEGPWLWMLPRGVILSGIVQLGMVVALVLLVSGLVKPSPASVTPGAAVPTGAFRITRHPVVMGIGLFGLLHLLANASTTDVAFFGGFPLFAVVGARHQDARKIAQKVSGYAEFVAATPFLPFTGRETLRGLRELSPVALGIGIGAAVLVRWAHRFWQGA